MRVREQHEEEAASSQETQVAAEARENKLGTVAYGGEPVDLAALYDQSVMLVTAPTYPSEAALLHAAAIAEAGTDSSTVQVGTPHGVPDPGSLGELSLRDGEDASAWASYLEEVTGLFVSLMGASRVGVRQIVSDGPQCPRLHVDRVVARGVLNVLGACTEWLDDADVDRSFLGHAGGPDDSKSGLVRRWDRLGRAKPGMLAVFKGTAWPGAEERAVVHRSPPADGARRLLLTLDCLE